MPIIEFSRDIVVLVNCSLGWLVSVSRIWRVGKGETWGYRGTSLVRNCPPPRTTIGL